MFKKITLLSLLLIVVFLFGCQPTPDEPIIINKGDGTLQNILAESYPPELSEPYQAPETWTETIDGMIDNKLIVEVDAEIIVPKSLSYPVFRSTKTELTQEIADKFIHYFIGDEKLYEYGEREKTDEHLRAILEKAEYQLNDPSSLLHTKYSEDIGDPHGAYELIKRTAEGWRDIALKQLSEPKNGEEMKPLFELANKYPYREFGLFTYNLDINIGIRESEFGRKVSYFTNNMNSLGIACTLAKKENLVDQDISLEDAIAKATNTIQGLGYGDWNLVNIGAVGMFYENFMDVLWDFDINKSMFEQPQGFWLTYTPRVYQDIPLLYYSNNDSDYSKNDFNIIGTFYSPPVDYQPSLHFAVFGDGIRYASLSSSMNVTDTVNENVPLLPFSKIQDIFRRYIIMNTNFNYGWERSGEIDENESGFISTTIRIKDVCLGYMEVLERNGGEDQLLIPVWMFYGTQHDRYQSQSVSEWQLDENNE
ncbi:MAG: YnbE family lipoprotein, partial [Clostridiales bacterium]|nr:YnbE family lipoprotein [Clostridiales bacterium]